MRIETEDALLAIRDLAGRCIDPRICHEDPLDDDGEDDQPVVTTRRGLMRIALVASETAARMQREGLAGDAMTWMISPHRVFSGATALDACMEKQACLRSIVMHGLGLGLDADPSAIDALIADDDGTAEEPVRRVVANNVVPIRGGGTGEATRRPRLFTASLVHQTQAGLLYAFAATVAFSASEATARILARHDAAAAGEVEVMEGFDATTPLVQALVSPALTDMLMQIAEDPASPLAAGLEIAIEQRFAA